MIETTEGLVMLAECLARFVAERERKAAEAKRLEMAFGHAVVEPVELVESEPVSCEPVYTAVQG